MGLPRLIHLTGRPLVGIRASQRSLSLTPPLTYRSEREFRGLISAPKPKPVTHPYHPIFNQQRNNFPPFFDKMTSFLKGEIDKKNMDSASANEALVLLNLMGLIAPPERKIERLTDVFAEYVSKSYFRNSDYIEKEKTRVKTMVEIAHANGTLNLGLYRDIVSPFVRRIEEIKLWNAQAGRITARSMGLAETPKIESVRRFLHELNGRLTPLSYFEVSEDDFKSSSIPDLFFLQTLADLGGILRVVVSNPDYVRQGVSVTLEIHGNLKAASLTPLQIKALPNVLQNLISNGVKYGRYGSSVFVTVRVLSSKILIGVADNGMGMSHAFRRKYFGQAGMREHKNLTPNVGMNQGIGVAHSFDQITTDMQGQILSITSKPNRGTSILFSFPLLNQSI